VQAKTGDEKFNRKIKSPKHQQHLDPPQTQGGTKQIFSLKKNKSTINPLRTPPSLPHLIIKIKIELLAYSLQDRKWK
jgi:hypothetical protein